MNDPQTLNDTVVRELEEGRLAQASGLIEQGRTRWPDNLRLAFTHSDVLLREGRVEAAADLLAGLMGSEEAARWAGPRLLAAVKGRSLSQESAARLIEPVVAGAAEERVKIGIVDALLGGRDSAQRAALLEPVAGRSGLARLLWHHAIALTEACRFGEARAVLEEMRRSGQATARSTLLEAELHATAGHPDRALDLIRTVTREHPDLPEGYRRRIAIARRACHFDECAEVLAEALERWPGDWSFPYLMNRVPLSPAALTRLFPLLEAAAAAPDRTERFAFQYGLACLHLGRIEEATRVLTRGFAEPTVSTMARPVAAALKARSAEAWRSGSRLDEDRTQEMKVVRAEGARTTVLLTTGMAFGYLPLPLVDTLLADLGVNVIYSRNFRYLVGADADTTEDRIEAETLAALRTEIAALGTERLVTIGNSLGGYTALRYGALLGADAAVSFSGSTELDSGLHEARPVIWNPAFFVRQMWLAQGGAPRDLVPVLARVPEMPVLHFHGAGSAGDVAQARRIAHLPNVRLFPVEGVDDHYSVDYLIGDGTFVRLIEALRDGRTWQG